MPPTTTDGSLEMTREAPRSSCARDLAAILGEAGVCVADLGPDDPRRRAAGHALSGLVSVIRPALDGRRSVCAGDPEVDWVVRLRELSVVGRRLLGRGDTPVPIGVLERAHIELAALSDVAS